jgi:hypothetical protein
VQIHIGGKYKKVFEAMSSVKLENNNCLYVSDKAAGSTEFIMLDKVKK